MKPTTYKVHKLIDDLAQEEYHQISGTFSSSQLKDMLKDEELFIAKYIDKTIPREASAAFDVGTYLHTGILEPHKLESDCIIYDGIRRGEKWDSFQAKHKTKTIVTKKQQEKALGLIKAVKDSPIAMEYVDRGEPEISLFVNITVDRGIIYAPKFNKVLTSGGWIDGIFKPSGKEVNIVLKVRADCLGDDFILDVKSTSGSAKNEKSIQGTITYWSYDLSASLYLDLFTLMRPKLKEFVWTFASKDCLNSKTWRATPKNILVGRAKYMKAVFKMASLMKNQWQLYDELGELEPEPSELRYLKINNDDL